jgi:hypothetical protein
MRKTFKKDVGSELRERGPDKKTGKQMTIQNGGRNQTQKSPFVVEMLSWPSVIFKDTFFRLFFQISRVIFFSTVSSIVVY